MESLTVETNQMKLPKTHFAQTQVSMVTLKDKVERKEKNSSEGCCHIIYFSTGCNKD